MSGINVNAFLANTLVAQPVNPGFAQTGQGFIQQQPVQQFIPQQQNFQQAPQVNMASLLMNLLQMLQQQGGGSPFAGFFQQPAVQSNSGRLFTTGVKEGDAATLGETIVDGNGFIPDNNTYRGFTSGQRELASGLSGVQLGASHFFGRGMAIGGREGGYAAMRTAFDMAANGTLEQTLGARDAAFIRFCLQQSQVTGLDPAQIGEQLFLKSTDQMGNSTRGTFSAMAANLPPIADNGSRLDIKSLDATNLTPDTVLLSSWYHDQLDNGAVDGSIWFTELSSGNALMKDANSQAVIRAMARLEAADGDIGNNSANKLKDNNGVGVFEGLFEAIYSGQKNVANVNDLNALANQEAARHGISVAQLDNMVGTTVNNFRQSANAVIQGMGGGIQRGLSAAADQAGTAMTSGMAGSALSAICPFLGAGVGAAQASLSGEADQAPTNHNEMKEQMS